MTTDSEKFIRAAEALGALWQQRGRCDGLPEDIRPATRTEGYAVQRAMAALHGQPLLGWKIAATSLGGQKHINVDGPLAGPLFADRVFSDGSELTLAGNLMRVAEIEFAFRFAHTLAPRDVPYTVDEVLAAVACVHPSIEVPDSRYHDFVTAGAPQLIADNACANLFILGPRADDWRSFDYVDAEVHVLHNGVPTASGFGRNVLGDPRVALTWLVNELSALGMAAEAGQVVTTGTCRVPVTVAPGDRVEADFGVLGRVSVRFAG